MKVWSHSLVSSDVDLATFAPPPGSAWPIQADVTVAPATAISGGDIFQFEIVSVSELRAAGPMVFTGRLLVLDDWPGLVTVEAFVWAHVESVAAATTNWENFARALNGTLQWEYENHR